MKLLSTNCKCFLLQDLLVLSQYQALLAPLVSFSLSQLLRNHLVFFLHLEILVDQVSPSVALTAISTSDILINGRRRLLQYPSTISIVGIFMKGLHWSIIFIEGLQWLIISIEDLHWGSPSTISMEGLHGLISIIDLHCWHFHQGSPLSASPSKVSIDQQD